MFSCTTRIALYGHRSKQFFVYLSENNTIQNGTFAISRHCGTLYWQMFDARPYRSIKSHKISDIKSDIKTTHHWSWIFPSPVGHGEEAGLGYRWYSGNYSTKPPSTKPSKYGSLLTIGGCHRVMWPYPNMGNGSCEVSMLLAMDLMESWDIEISTRGVEGCQSSNVVQKWLDMYRDQGGYISTCHDWGRKRSSKEIDGCPLTQSHALLWDTFTFHSTKHGTTFILSMGTVYTPK
jgi:hypothetical protein